jgi:hypothetical protein
MKLRQRIIFLSALLLGVTLLVLGQGQNFPGGTTGTVTFVNNTITGGVSGGTLSIQSGGNNNLSILQSGSGTLTVGSAGGFSATRAVFSGRVQIGDEGSCTMAAGTCTAQSFVATYTVAPKCFVTVAIAAGTQGFYAALSTTTTVTPASSNAADTSTVNWICFGN